MLPRVTLVSFKLLVNYNTNIVVNNTTILVNMVYLSPTLLDSIPITIFGCNKCSYCINISLNLLQMSPNNFKQSILILYQIFF